MRRTRCLLAMTVLVAGHASAQYSLHFGGGGTVQVREPRLQATDQIAIEFWIRTASPVRKPIHVVSQWDARQDATDHGTFAVGLPTTNRVAFSIRNAAGKVESIQGKGPRDDNRWHHLAACWDGAKLSVWLDGKVTAQRDVEGFGPLADSKLPLVIGPRPTKKSRAAATFDGFLGGLRLWRRVPRLRPITASVREPAAGEPTEIVSDYRLTARAPTDTVADESGRSQGRLDRALARAGWCATTDWRKAQPAHPDLHCYDVAGENRSCEFLVGDAKGKRVGVLWQDRGDGTVRITWTSPTRNSDETLDLPGGARDRRLAAGVSDPAGNLYYLTIQDVGRNRSDDSPIAATLHKASAAGKSIRSSPLDTSRSAFNIWSFGRRGRASMRFSKGTLGLILPRTMYRSRDGLNHQSAIAVSFSAKTLAVSRMLGTTSSHSMGHVLSVGPRGDFLGVDLGDNYPRGVHVHRFTATNKLSRVVFTYKTAHGRRPRNGSPVYDEISGDGKTFYKWSNDNSTYTELGGIVEGRKAYYVIFATDQSPAGKVLDNSRAFRGCEDPRNLALIRVSKKLAGGRGSVVGDSTVVGVRKGAKAETGGFFNFGGGWTKQRVVGVNWLTSYASRESAHAPQVVQLADKSTLILWHKRGRDRDSVQSLRLDRNGKPLGTPQQLDVPLRWRRGNRMLRLGKRIWFLASNAADERQSLYYLRD